MSRGRAVALLLAAACSLGAATARGDSGGNVTARFLVPAPALAAFVPVGLHTDLIRLRPVARRAVAARHTNLARAIALRDVVRAGVPPGATSCLGYAAIMATLGRELGLPVRLTVGTDGVSDFDTHSTVSVWAPAYKRWVIVDPTFGGIFTRGRNGPPLGAAALRDAVLHGWSKEVFWHSSHRKNAQLPSDYYVDPVYLFRYIGVYAWIDGRLELVVLPDSTMLSSGVAIVDERTLAYGPPNVATAAHAAAVDWIAARPDALTLPPPYADRQIWSGAVGSSGTIGVPQQSVVVWVSAPGAVVNGYETTPVDGGSLSPIFVAGTIQVDGVTGASVRVFAARLFPASNQR